MSEVSTSSILRQVVGTICNHIVCFGAGTLVVFLDGDLHSKHPKAPWRVYIDCAWKITDTEVLRAGSFDDPALVQATANLLVGLAVTEITFDVITGDLIFCFGEMYKLLIFPYSFQDEHWQIRRKDGFRLTFGPDAQLTQHYEEPDATT